MATSLTTSSFVNAQSMHQFIRDRLNNWEIHNEKNQKLNADQKRRKAIEDCVVHIRVNIEKLPELEKLKFKNIIDLLETGLTHFSSLISRVNSIFNKNIPHEVANKNRESIATNNTEAILKNSEAQVACQKKKVSLDLKNPIISHLINQIKVLEDGIKKLHLVNNSWALTYELNAEGLCKEQNQKFYKWLEQIDQENYSFVDDSLSKLTFEEKIKLINDLAPNEEKNLFILPWTFFLIREARLEEAKLFCESFKVLPDCLIELITALENPKEEHLQFVILENSRTRSPIMVDSPILPIDSPTTMYKKLSYNLCLALDKKIEAFLLLLEAHEFNSLPNLVKHLQFPSEEISDLIYGVWAMSLVGADRITEVDSILKKIKSQGIVNSILDTIKSIQAMKKEINKKMELEENQKFALYLENSIRRDELEPVEKWFRSESYINFPLDLKTKIIHQTIQKYIEKGHIAKAVEFCKNLPKNSELNDLRETLEVLIMSVET